jgi:hypothetical protein
MLPLVASCATGTTSVADDECRVQARVGAPQPSFFSERANDRVLNREDQLSINALDQYQRCMQAKR